MAKGAGTGPRIELKTAEKVSNLRGSVQNIVSYLTLPLDLLRFLPGVGGLAQKGIEEVVGVIIEKKMKKHRWFYMLSEVSEKP